MFGILPAHGLYLRHLRGLVMENVRWTAASADARAAIFREDVAAASRPTD